LLVFYDVDLNIISSYTNNCMYVLMINIHGLIRGEDVEFGRDADTGGQTRYVIDLVKNLSNMDRINKVDLITRMIKDKRVSKTYSESVEVLSDKSSIIRLPCGGGKYLHKEKLWPYLDEFTDQLISYIRSNGKIPDIVHGHYADGGYVAMQIAETFGIPFVFTAHSLGRNKLSFLKSIGWSEAKADSELSIKTRIDAEEEILSQVDLVITSTNYEKEELYSLYLQKDAPRYDIIPPGINLDIFYPYYHNEIPGQVIREESKQAFIRTQNELKRFYFDPEKPLILSLCRPDARKNIDLLIEVYGKDKELQAMANLAIFAGIRDDITMMEEGEQKVLTDMLLAMDKYDLYGKMAIPKHHDANLDVPELYRIAALKRGVFVSASFLETFGLTFIEASASGLPFIATKMGGPVDIEKNCKSGILIDVENPETITSAIKKVITDNVLWNTLSESGVNRTRKVYTWDSHCQTYLDSIDMLRKDHLVNNKVLKNEFRNIGKRIHALENLLIVDIDGTLIGDNASTEMLRTYLKDHHEKLGFGVATGRDIYSAQEVLHKHGLDNADIFISSVGTEIYYGESLSFDKGWRSHIHKKWKPDLIRSVLSRIPFLTLQQGDLSQRPFKISYEINNGNSKEEAIPLIHNELLKHNLAYHLIFSHGTLVDILPYRASKGQAINYLAKKWQINHSKIITAGNSGNDRDMLIGKVKGIVVGNYESELQSLKKNKNVYFSKEYFAAGIRDGLSYWRDETKRKNNENIPRI
jgi:sucrose-phosphate synthase